PAVGARDRRAAADHRGRGGHLRPTREAGLSRRWFDRARRVSPLRKASGTSSTIGPPSRASQHVPPAFSRLTQFASGSRVGIRPALPQVRREEAPMPLPLMLALLTGLTDPSATGPSPRSVNQPTSIHIALRCYTPIPRAILAPAQRAVTRIYGAARVQVVWRGCVEG